MQGIVTILLVQQSTLCEKGDIRKGQANDIHGAMKNAGVHRLNSRHNICSE